MAGHTNGTIGALLNATFGNAPELLIASAALRKGFYRVVQLAMLGSMLTNLLFVFGMSCLIGGLRWQVQELRITSGNVSVGMLLLSTAGSLLPASLIIGGQLKHSGGSSSITASASDDSAVTPTLEELQFCRVNAFIMIIMYGCYLIFQLGTHKEEFDEEYNVVQTADDNRLHLSPHFTSRHGRQHKARRNIFCQWMVHRIRCLLRLSNINDRNRLAEQGWIASPSITAEREYGDVEMMHSNTDRNSLSSSEEYESTSDEACLLPQNAALHHDHANGYFDDYNTERPDSPTEPRLRSRGGSITAGITTNSQRSLSPHSDRQSNHRKITVRTKSKKRKKRKKKRQSGVLLPLGLAEPPEKDQTGEYNRNFDFLFYSHSFNLSITTLCSHVFVSSPVPPQLPNLDYDNNHRNITHPPVSTPQMSFRVGILWLLIITCGVSAMSDILVDTIDGFAIKLHISEVFTSMIIVPFFSNVAEQVSAILFAYRNEMDLCVGVTVGSAIQVASFVLPGCVIIGWLVDRSMTLYFHAYETACLFLAVIVVAAVLQGGTTNWLVGATCISVYFMIATGFWFHSLEDLSVDAESTSNSTRGLLAANCS